MVFRKVEQHYSQKSRNLVNKLFSPLTALGKNANQITHSDIAPIEEFHLLGAEATSEMADLLQLSPSMHVLDAGCGIGGPSRHLAEDYGCKVTGIDLTGDYRTSVKPRTFRGCRETFFA